MSKEENKPAIYDESKVKTLSSLEHIRLRSGMYIGRLGDGSNPDDGIYVLVKEVIDNSIDEYIMGFGKRIDVNIDYETKIVSVRDFGRGIPLGKVVDCVSKINTGAKYNDDVFQFSVGLNGVGTKAVNALSEDFTVTSYREGKFKSANFSKGKLLTESDGAKNEKDGTYFEFTPDREIFSKFNYVDDFLRRRIRYYTYLNSGLKLYLNGEKFQSNEGLKDLLEDEVQDDKLYPIIHHKGEKIEFAFTHSVNYGENHFSFVNGQFTNEGGTHLSAFREGILKGVNEFSKKSFQGVDVRDGIIGAISIKLKDPIFESQTKNKLGNADIRGWIVNEVKEAVSVELYKDEELAKIILDKVSHNERIRKELQNVKKEAREKAKKISIKIPNLRDCKHHFGDKHEDSDKTMIFLTEGQSASGSIVSCRDVYTQAVFSLRGKPFNCFGMKRDQIYKNQELYNIMKALDIEDSIDDLRYNKIVISTDADVDGLHIRNLLLTFFLHYFETLVVRGHVYVLETPLFRVRDKKETIYCFSESERVEAFKKIKNPEVTRFKGLGEISPKEFGQFIGDEIRLTQVGIEHIKEISKILEFYMGKNTPARKQYIMENLV
ncbi:MAG: type IIA DNA topoisomerase subunit B [Calditrichaeota bacterium]|nr:MAG: type IIA DNA topoisomerase subunit B [Calditrichota bacterium]